ncbi:hypothetical protein O3G_MSEX012065 [Manduca sexta]|uniref:Uncharacterized protein n=1 Tax=Manduca sexta TaxID=7130 RepID=A0A921ZPA4_MANSE|nr:hypothetical protein O3G_MSEX012065 [Manduca sexta]
MPKVRVRSTSKLLDLSAVSESAQVVISSPTSQDKESSDPTSNVQFSDFIKLPEKTTVAKEKQRRKKQHATVLTSTPLKKDLIEKENKKITKIQKEQEKEKRNGKVRVRGRRLRCRRVRVPKGQRDRFFKIQTIHQSQTLTLTTCARMTKMMMQKTQEIDA